MKALLVLLAIALPATLCEAQRTWRVGALSIPGNDFDEIQPAVDAASPGDVIIVDAHGSIPYPPVTTNKGVALLSTNGWSLRTSISVHDLPAGQRFAMEGFGGSFPFVARNCTGSVHLETIRAGPPGFPSTTFGVSSTFDNCTLVTMNQCSLWNVTMRGGRLSAAHCGFLGTADGVRSEIGVPALTIIDADVTLGGGFVIGPPYQPDDLANAVPGVWMRGGVFRFAGRNNQEFLQGGLMHAGGQPFAFTPSVISDGGTVIIDPDVRVLDSLLGTSAYVFEDLPYMRIVRVPPPSIGFDIPIDVYASPVASVFVAISLPAYPLATFLGDLWLDPSPGGIVLVASGMTDATGVFSIRSPLNRPWPLGIVPAFQSVIVDQGRIRLSAPVIGVMGFEP